MALDGIFLSFLTKEVSDLLVGSKVDKIHQPSKNELVFVMRTKNGMYKLWLSADANAPRFHITENAPENPQNPPMLCMLLRKKLQGATLTAVKQSGLDRIVFFCFDASNEIGDRVKLTLVSEIMAQHSNIILLDENSKIIDAVKRVNSEKSSYRLVLPGALYKFPPEQSKCDLREFSANSVTERILSFESQKLSSALLKTVQGVSPAVTREIAYKTCFSDKTASELSDIEKENLCAVISDIKEKIENNTPEFTVLYDESGKPFEFSYINLAQYGETFKREKFLTASKTVDFFYSSRDEMVRTRSRASQLFKELENIIERTSRKLNNQREDLKNTENREELKINAELITASQYSLKKGASFYEVFDYYNNDMKKIEVDPSLTPSLNAQKLYKEYRKACTAENMLKKLIEENENNLVYLESVKDLLSRSSLEREFAEIKSELVNEGFLKKHTDNKKQIKKSLLPPLEFCTSEGFRVLVGRNNVCNDKLTFKTGKKGDIWLHSQKAPGSHTLLVADNKEITDKAIVEAAEIAAFYSSLKNSTLVTVDYTDVKNIKKPNGAKPGFVVYYTYYSVNVKPKKPE